MHTYILTNILLKKKTDKGKKRSILAYSSKEVHTSSLWWGRHGSRQGRHEGGKQEVSWSHCIHIQWVHNEHQVGPRYQASGPSPQGAFLQFLKILQHAQITSLQAEKQIFRYMRLIGYFTFKHQYP